eukprot:TRINITY_DN34134_c0_g1_i1.p1 TRINITY_DN34134_c0_g1~~TRINITY_DN34134_c0_g1_i1.p1  ORF type:complete len:169 (+),score=26.94 TRINITY_DN34134_c0_g1_i1:67-507(+)
MAATAPAGYPQQIQQGVRQMPVNNVTLGNGTVAGRVPQQAGYAQPVQQQMGGLGNAVPGMMPAAVPVNTLSAVGPRITHKHHGHRRHHHHHHHRSRVSVPINSPGGANSGGYHFTLPTNQGFDVSPGDLHLPASTTGYTITYSKQG